DDLPLDERRVEARASRCGAVAERPVARPEIDTCSGRLVRVDARCTEGRPAPRPDRAEIRVHCDLLRGERLPLDDPEPGLARLDPLPAARALASSGVEADTHP